MTFGCGREQEATKSVEKGANTLPVLGVCTRKFMYHQNVGKRGRFAQCFSLIGHVIGHVAATAVIPKDQCGNRVSEKSRMDKRSASIVRRKYI